MIYAMKNYLFILMLLLPFWMFAQERQIVEANSNTDLADQVSTQMQYIFPEFTDGQVYYLKSSAGIGKLNYNILIGEMQFLDKEEVMALVPAGISVVNINNRSFFPYKGNEFAEELLSTGKYKLLVRRKGNVASFAKKGAYGTSSSTSSITSYSSINSDGQSYNLSVANDVLITVRYFYYLMGENGKYTQITNAKTFTKQFPALRTQIETFVKEQKIRFDKEEDLKKLLVYCSGLS